jgi:alkylation response protein AidB-like acyl-CoA dehydrogenase
MRLIRRPRAIRGRPISSSRRQRVRATTIFEGTEQIQQLVISRAISGLRIE